MKKKKRKSGKKWSKRDANAMAEYNSHEKVRLHALEVRDYRVGNLLQRLGIGFQTLRFYASILNIEVSDPNGKLSKTEAGEIKEYHIKEIGNQKPVRQQIKKLKFSKFSDRTELPHYFEQNNPYERSIKKLLVSKDPFRNRESTKRTYLGKSFESVLSNVEAAIICGGLENRRLQDLSRKFYEGNLNVEEVIELHYAASVAHQKYGGKLLSFCMSLPKLPFKAFDATQIFSEMDKRKSRGFPVIRLLIKDRISEKISIAFYSYNSPKGRIRNTEVLEIKDQRNKRMMMISRDSRIVIQRTDLNFKPILEMFTRFSKNPRKMIINYGHETGECSICGRKLTDKESVRRGIGPVCGGWR
ncbi:MAG: DUF6011 domain-containing protein [Bacteroidota bacterium]